MRVAGTKDEGWEGMQAREEGDQTSDPPLLPPPLPAAWGDAEPRPPMVWRLLARLALTKSDGEVGTLRRELRVLRGAEEVGACGRMGRSRRVGKLMSEWSTGLRQAQRRRQASGKAVVGGTASGPP